jgi:hypothetical protein
MATQRRTTKRNSVSAKRGGAWPDVSRKIPHPVRVLLSVRAGGRCEFDGHNVYLFEHPLTLQAGFFGQAAHIIAFSQGGPRAIKNKKAGSQDIHDVENLMLLCSVCHKLVDDNPLTYTEAVLRKYKINHEARIRHLTELGPDRSTAVLVVRGPIAGQLTTVPFSAVVDATSPRYPTERAPMEIDLSHLDDRDASFLKAACETVNRRLEALLQPSGAIEKAGHLSIFAMGPMPLLIHLGSRLSNKIPTDLYQRHRGSESWAWKSRGKPVQYAFRKVQSGEKGVALILSLSGTIPVLALPESVRAKATVYELTLKSPPPSPTFLRTRRDLEAFRMAYQQALAEIARENGLVASIDLFPAVPAPIAILVGRELLPKVHPKLNIYDHDKSRSGFKKTIEVNHHGNQ